MIEFNPDGSIKRPGQFGKIDEENKNRMRNQRCIKVEKQIVSFTSPKKCVLRITLSEAFPDNRFIDTIYARFKEKAAVPNKITKIHDKLFEVEIGTDFRRCTDCCSLINEYKDFLDGNVIEMKGSCSFESRPKKFCYEDYFD